MGIGGLDSEFSNIFRRAFASRVFPLGLVEKLGIQHVKGAHTFHTYAFLTSLQSRHPAVRPARNGQDTYGTANRQDVEREGTEDR